MQQLSLPAVLAQIQQNISLKQWKQADRTIAEVLEQLPVTHSRAVFALQIQSLKCQDREDDARAALIRRLMLDPVLHQKTGSTTSAPNIVVLFGLQAPKPLIQMFKNGEFTISINAGHFKVVDVLQTIDCNLWQIFLHEAVDVEALLKQIPQPDLVINSIADPEREAESLYMAEKLLDIWQPEAAIINKPARVLLTTRNQVSLTLGKLTGIDMPRTIRRDPGHQPLPVNEFNLEAGVFVRPVGVQTAYNLARYHDADKLQAYIQRQGAEALYLTQFREFQSVDGMWRKYRFFLIDGKLYPEHLLIADSWNLHSADRLKCMLDNKALQDEEAAFLADPVSVIGEQHYKVLHNTLLGFELDYVGVDFTMVKTEYAHSIPCIFEANPAMRINQDYVNQFPYQRTALDAILEAFRSMIGNKIRTVNSST